MGAVRQQDFFDLFGLPPRFTIDAQDLAARYRGLQREFHPDRYATAPDSERRRAVQMTATINEAFQTLKDPVTRGRYLLQLRGVDTGEELDTRMDPGFLEEQMELRERLEDSGDAAAYETLLQDVGARFEARVHALGAALDRGTLDGARSLVRELQFLKKLRGEIEFRLDG